MEYVGTYNTKRGLTFIEMVLVVGVFALVMTTITGAILYFYRTNSYAVEQAYAVESARKGVEFLVRDIREATYSDNGAYPIISMGDNTLLFYSDVDRDNSVERIRYRLVNGLLEKGITNATGNPAVYNDVDEEFSIIAGDVRNEDNSIPIFSYLDTDGVAVTNFSNVTDVAFINVNLIININPSRLPEDFVLRSSATLRNLKTNL